MCNTFNGPSFLMSVSKVPVSPLQRRVKELKQFTQQLQSVHPSVFAKALYRSILYQDKNILVINKPYGVPVHSRFDSSLQELLYFDTVMCDVIHH